ncbi:molybdenum cofactor biosynthesis prote [Atractiella rhizophila]|nr:molybdenum cofactor biosynthesis prote [Atractiella rhizophila]
MRSIRSVTSTLGRSASTVAEIARARIQSLDKTSPYLIDSFNRQHTYLRLSLTEKCNLRCTYCMPDTGVELLPKENILTADELYKLADLFVKQGVKKVRLTGGEPTIRRDIVEIVDRIASLKNNGLESIGMTSNGIALRRKLKSLKDAGLDNINLSLDTLDPFKFELITRRRGFEAVLSCLDEAVAVGFKVKLNCVVIAGLNDAEVLQFVSFVRDRPIQVRFIEYMPFEDNRWSTKKLVPSSVLQERIKAVHPSFAQLPMERHATTRVWSIDGSLGRIGFISSMTEHFCAGCDRIRVGADGGLKVCLFGAPVLQLRELLRNGSTDEEIYIRVQGALQGKKWKHDGHAMPEDIARNGRSGPMVGIGRSFLPWLHPPSSSNLFRHARTYSTHSTATTTKQQNSEREEEQPLDTHGLTHISPSGRLKMSPITSKTSSIRRAVAVGFIRLPPPAVQSLLHPAVSKKGDVITVSRVAGIQAAKRTDALIPLCHSVGLTDVVVDFDLDEEAGVLHAKCLAECEGKTGVEMEALVGVSTALLTVWDMLKSVGGREMEIGGIMVVEKSGGRSGSWTRLSM